MVVWRYGSKFSLVWYLVLVAGMAEKDTSERYIVPNERSASLSALTKLL